MKLKKLIFLVGTFIVGFGTFGEMFFDLPEVIEVSCYVIGGILLFIGYRGLKKEGSILPTTVTQQKNKLVILFISLTTGLIITIFGMWSRVSAFPKYAQLIYWVGMGAFYLFWVVFLFVIYNKRTKGLERSN